MQATNEKMWKREATKEKVQEATNRKMREATKGRRMLAMHELLMHSVYVRFAIHVQFVCVCVCVALVRCEDVRIQNVCLM